MAKDWVRIRNKALASEFDALRNKIHVYPDNFMDKKLKPELNRIAKEGVELIRFIILTTPNKTKPEDGRYDTGAMYKAVKARVRPGKGTYSVFVGWTDGKPGYSVFQEHGTSQGLIGMNALGQAREYMLQEIAKLKNGSFNSTTSTGFDFDSSED